MLTVPWLITSYVKALYGGQGPPVARGDSNTTLVSTSAGSGEREIRPPTQYQQLQRQQIQRPQNNPQQQQQSPQPRIRHSQASQQQQQQQQQPKTSAPPPRQPTKLPVSANNSPKSAVSVASKPVPVQAQVARQVQGEPPKQEENPTQTSTKTLVLKPSISENKMSHEWVQKQVDQFQFTFDEADKDKSGSLSFAEIFGVLKAQGFKGSEEEAQFIFKDLDRDRNKSISREEFTAAVKKIPKLSIKEFCLRKMFKNLDRDGSGFLTRAEIADATKKELVGMDISEGRISDMLIAHCKDDDSKIEYEEFLRIFGFEEAASVVHQMFTRLDTDKSGYLTRTELLDAVKAESGQTLSTQFADKIADLVIHLVTDADKKISYEEFNKVWLKEREKK